MNGFGTADVNTLKKKVLLMPMVVRQTDKKIVLQVSEKHPFCKEFLATWSVLPSIITVSPSFSMLAPVGLTLRLPSLVWIATTWALVLVPMALSGLKIQGKLINIWRLSNSHYNAYTKIIRRFFKKFFSCLFLHD